jgi:hypothetical protein
MVTATCASGGCSLTSKCSRQADQRVLRVGGTMAGCDKEAIQLCGPRLHNDCS